ncbi:hypothetical protein A2U01_0021632, partial [Trifolium medium]|nr:hypothetical protein [Trifolium medium]
MDSVFDLVSDLQPGREAWRIKEGCEDLGCSNFLNQDQTNSVQMVLNDEK